MGSSEREHLHIALAQLSGDGRFTADELMAYHYGESGPNQQAKCLYHLELAADAALAMHADQEAEYLFGRLLMPGAGVETVTDDVHAKWLSSIAKARVRLRKGHTAKQECLHALELLDMPAPTSSAHCVDTSFQILLGREPLPEDAQEAEWVASIRALSHCSSNIVHDCAVLQVWIAGRIASFAWSDCSGGTGEIYSFFR